MQERQSAQLPEQRRMGHVVGTLPYRLELELLETFLKFGDRIVP
jgi:hypothetical protein